MDFVAYNQRQHLVLFVAFFLYLIETRRMKQNTLWNQTKRKMFFFFFPKMKFVSQLLPFVLKGKAIGVKLKKNYKKIGFVGLFYSLYVFTLIDFNKILNWGNVMIVYLLMVVEIIVAPQIYRSMKMLIGLWCSGSLLLRIRCNVLLPMQCFFLKR